MTINENGAAVKPASGHTWPELTGVMPRRGTRGIGMEAACWEAEHGNTVVAMQPLDQTDGEKKPMEKWKTLGYRTPEQIRSTDAFKRRCGVAILTGPSGKVVIDTDGKAGPRSLARIRGERRLPRTRKLATPGGTHRIFKDDGVEYKTQAGQMGEGIDVRGRGGLELVYDPGQPGRHYTDLHEPVSVPRWFRPKIPKADEPALSNGHKASLDIAALVADGIPPGQHDETMMRLAMKLNANELLDREQWPLLAQGILQRSGEGIDASGRGRGRFGADRIMGWWDSASGKLDDGEPVFTVRPMSDVFEEVCEDIGPDMIAPVSGITAVIGESNVGKSPLCYYILLMRVRAGQSVGIYETEMGARRIQKKLRELGATDEELGQILNFGDWGVKDRDLITNAAALTREVRGRRLRTFLLDSQIGLISASGISENDASAVRNWVNQVAGSMVAAGISVIIIDHTGLGDDSRGRGTSDKKPSCDFAVVMKEVRTGRVGVSGEYTLECTKDRSARFIGSRMKLYHLAEEDGSFTYKPDGWDDELDFSGARSIRESAGTTQQKIVAAMRVAPGDLPRDFTLAEAVAETGLEEKIIKSAMSRGETRKIPLFEHVERGLWRVVAR
jgi:hypothetical protein